MRIDSGLRQLRYDSLRQSAVEPVFKLDANMKSRREYTRTQISEMEIDAIVESQSDDDSFWTKPIKVRKARLDSLFILTDVAARAAFLASVAREKAGRVVD